MLVLVYDNYETVPSINGQFQDNLIVTVFDICFAVSSFLVHRINHELALSILINQLFEAICHSIHISICLRCIVYYFTFCPLLLFF